MLEVFKNKLVETAVLGSSFRGDFNVYFNAFAGTKVSLKEIEACREKGDLQHIFNPRATCMGRIKACLVKRHSFLSKLPDAIISDENKKYDMMDLLVFVRAHHGKKEADTLEAQLRKLRLKN